MLATTLLAALLALSPASASDPVLLLQELIRIQTVNPPGNETSLTRPLADLFRANGLDVELVGPRADRKSLLVKIPGRTSGKPWLALAHIDTVHAEAEAWRHPPFAGLITDGNVWGRGALDDKGMAAALAVALIRLHKAGTPPRVPIIALFAADEEAGSREGIEWLLQQRPELYEVEGVLNEGGFTLIDAQGPAKRTYYVSVGEKGVAWLRLTAEGKPGHGSIRWGDNANEKLIGALNRVLSMKHAEALNSPTGQFAMADLRRRGKTARSVREALRKHALGKQVDRDPTLQSSLTNTCNLTVLKAGEKHNVIPSSSEALVDCRLIPGHTPERFAAAVRRRVGADVKVELAFSATATESPWETPFFAALRDAASERDANALVVPVLSAGATDSRFWRQRGIPAYGIVPIPVTPGQVAGMHGVDEHVSAEGVRDAADFLTATLRRLAY